MCQFLFKVLDTLWPIKQTLSFSPWNSNLMGMIDIKFKNHKSIITNGDKWYKEKALWVLRESTGFNLGGHNLD